MKQLILGLVIGFVLVWPALRTVAQETGKIDKKIEQSKLPREVGLTEVQRLKLENAQLKLRELDRQIKELQKQISDELTGAMKLASVPESEFGNYGFDQSGKLIYVEPKQVSTPAKK